jgi:hypothetical protein
MKKVKSSDTRGCGLKIFFKSDISRYSSHHRLDAEHPALLLEVVALLISLLVTHDTIITFE